MQFFPNMCPRRLFSLAVIASAGLVMSGCLINSSSRTYQSGTYVGSGTLAQIEPGKTDQAFVLAALGPPSSQTSFGDGAELWKWQYARRRSSTGGVFLLVHSNSHNESRITTHMVMRDGIVERVWQD